MKDFIKRIEVENIDFDTHQPRQKFQEDKIKDLAANIEELGLLIPIEVTPYIENNSQVELGTKEALNSSDRKWWLIDGARRLKACEVLKWAKISAKVRMDLSFLEMLDCQFAMNSKRVQVDIKEMAKAIERYKAEFLKECPDEDPIKRLMKLTGFSHTYFDAVEAINRAPEPFREATLRGSVAGYTASEIEKSSKDLAIREGLCTVFLETEEDGGRLGANAPRILKKTGDIQEIEKRDDLTHEQKTQITREVFSGYMGGKHVDISFMTAEHKVRKLLKEFMAWNLDNWASAELDKMASLLLAFSDHLREWRRMHNKL